MDVLNGTKILVLVDEALPDIIVVSYVHKAKIFRGVLLDTTKRKLPCGVQKLNPALQLKPGQGKEGKINADDDVLYSVNQRYAYTDSTHITTSTTTSTTTNRLKNNKIGKMTVRLRPRQVLCSKCKDICNENSESITRKRKAAAAEEEEEVVEAAAAAIAITSPSPTSTSTMVASSPSPPKRSANAPVTRSSANAATMRELPNALSGNVNKLNIDNNRKTPLAVQSNQGNNSLNHVEGVDEERTLKRVIITRKKSVSSAIECPWENDTNKTEHPAAPGGAAVAGGGGNTRTIKICFGPQGEGTVLKIPAQIENLRVGSTDEDEEDLPEENDVEEAARATRKAMKKAKKEKAKKKITFQTTIGSPEQSSSTRYTTGYSIGSSSPRYTVGSASPRHGLGNNSPRFVASLPPIPVTSFEPTPKKRKHKVKHKKKHKEDRDRKHKDDRDDKDKEKICSDSGSDKCLTQKLSINLKRLSGSYTTLTSTVADSTSNFNDVDKDKDVDRERDDKEDESSSDEVPDFPPGPLRLKLTAKNLNYALSFEGEQLQLGDIVWGKLQGFPWWPGKIISITNCDNGLGPRPQANVSWFGSATSSVIQCDQLSSYLAHFKARYNKKRRGPYKEAIKQATNEAESKNSAPESSTTATSPSRMIMLVPPALASPREINVIS